MTGLVIYSSGGHRVATEDLWWLTERLEQVATRGRSAVNELRHTQSDYRPESWQALMTGCSRWLEDVAGIASALLAYSEQVADQERFRTSLVIGDGLIDDVARVARELTGGGPRSVTVMPHGIERDVPIAQGVAERLARLPETDHPIRVERYPLPDGTHHTEVFISGTREWSLGQERDPFDMHSNLALVAGVPAAASLAARQALVRAGVTPSDPVVFVGHSQGGAVATALAESGRFRTRALITAGAPVGLQPVTGDYPALRIEHTDDPIVALGGTSLQGEQVIVRTDSGEAPWDVAGAHGSETYIDTAKRIDQSPVSVLRTLTADLPRGTEGTAQVFDAVSAPSGDGGVAAGKTSQ